MQRCLELEAPLFLVGLVPQYECPGVQEEPDLSRLGQPAGGHDREAARHAAQKLHMICGISALETRGIIKRF